MPPYPNRRYWKVLWILLGLSGLSVLFSVYNLSSSEIATPRRQPASLVPYKCPFNSSHTFEKPQFPEPILPSNVTEGRILLLLESAYSRHGKLLLLVLNALKYPYKTEVLSKNLPMLTTAVHGRYSLVIVENYYKYLNLPKWNRQLLDKYCREYKVPIISFLTTRANVSYNRAKIKGSGVYIWQNQTINSLMLDISNIHRIGRSGARLDELSAKEWVLFEDGDGQHSILSAESQGVTRSAAIYDSGKTDGVQRVLFGYNVSDWVVKMTFVDTLSFFSAGQISWPLERFIQVDIDDIFVGARGTRMVEEDVRALVTSQKRLREKISNFTYTLGFSGSYFRNGDDAEDRGDELLVEKASNFVWFPHMWRHNHAHEHNGTYLEATMAQNKLFAQNLRLPVPYSYAIAPQHDGVYPVHEELYSAWLKVWNVKVTATEEYPHFKPATSRRGFIYRNISVLPRQTCGLYTHTQFFDSYPEGSGKLLALIHGGELFSAILLNPISIFMTHQQNYAHDRLAIFTFESIVNFVNCWTNLKLRWQDPISSAKQYFSMFPAEKTPIWSNPCEDPRHRSILPPQLNCSSLTLPNLLIVGPQKTGSTALASFLSLHPNVSTNLPIPGSFEELQFFGAANYARGLQWYLSNFNQSHVVFEKSATYFDNTDTARQVAALLPSTNIVVILYDPAVRAYSWYQHLLAHNDTQAISAGSLEAIIDSNSTTLVKTRQRCLSGGRYSHHLDRWTELFPLSQLHLLDGDKLKKEPQKVVKWLAERLGLPKFDFDSHIRYSHSKGYFCQLVDGKTKCLGKGKGRSYPPLSAPLRRRLNEIFKSDNLALHSMPKYYCDYCDTFLTHDSPSVRKTHNGGRKHKENVRMFYQKWMEDQAQKLVDATARAFAGSQVRSALASRPLLGAPMMPSVAQVPLRPFGAFPAPGAMPFVPPVGVVPVGPQPMMPPNQFRGGF